MSLIAGVLLISALHRASAIATSAARSISINDSRIKLVATKQETLEQDGARGRQAGLSSFSLSVGAFTVHHCVLREVDAYIHGCKPNHASLRATGRDPTFQIRAAGWLDFEYRSFNLDNLDQEQTQLADRFGIVLYRATLPPNKHHLRNKVYNILLTVLDETDDGVWALMEEVMFGVSQTTHQTFGMSLHFTTHCVLQVDWDLGRLHAKLKGAYEFPTPGLGRPSTALKLPGPGKHIIPFPRKLYEIKFYRSKFDACKAEYLAAYPAGVR